MISSAPLIRRRPARVGALLILGCVLAAEAMAAEEPRELSETERLLEDIVRIRSQYRSLETEKDSVEGEERTVVVLQLRKTGLELIHSVDELLAGIVRQQAEGVDRPSGMTGARRLLLAMSRTIPKYIDRLEADESEIRTALAEAPPGSRKDLAIQLEEIGELLDEAYPFFAGHLRHREALEIAPGRVRGEIEQRARKRASTLAGRIDLLSARKKKALADAQASPDDAAIRATVYSVEELLDEAASSLWTICDVLDELGIETADYRKVLIRSTGEITGDILDVDVVSGLLEDTTAAARKWWERRGPPLIAEATLFFAILASFWLLGRSLAYFASRLAQRAEKVSELSRRLISSTISRGVVIVGFFVALSQLGVNVTALLAGLGIAGFIVGFALQDTLGNFASGAMILIYQPFDVGDVVEAGGVYGKVDGMSLVSTTILTFDNQTLVVPNSRIWGDVIRNVTAQDLRRVDLEFGFSHELDVARAEEVLASVLAEHPKVLEEPEPLIKVNKLTTLTTQIVVRPWVKGEDYWTVYWDLMREVKLRLDREGIPLGLPLHAAPVAESLRDGTL